jgi:riboflavin transporter FmnP
MTLVTIVIDQDLLGIILLLAFAVPFFLWVAYDTERQKYEKLKNKIRRIRTPFRIIKKVVQL